MQARFTEEEISQLNQSNKLTVTAKAGTLLVADTRGIHRGQPIEQGERYALTVYSWATEMPPQLAEFMINP